MAAFDYVALDQRGRKQKGVLEADSARQVRQLLRDKGWMPLEANQAVEKKGSNGLLVRRKGLSVRDLALITRQIATLVQSGIPIEETLTAVASQSEKPAIRSMILAIRSKVMEGFTLADSLAEYPGAFPKLYRSTVAAGEAAGHLDLVLNRLADYTESRQAARQKIQLAAIYPIILSVVAIAIVVFLLTYVVPDIIEVFINNGQALPPLTQGLLNVSDFLAAWGGALAVLMFLAFVVFRYMLRKKSFRFAWHKQLLMMPFVKKLSRGTNTAQFASTLSILTSSGVPLVEAMKISSEVLGNDCLKGSLQVAAQQVSEGASLHKALDNTGYFPPMMVHMIASGESSGELDQMLERTSSHQESDLAALIETIVGLFEPLMLLFMGAVVLVIVLAIMLPILGMSNLVG
ncbi:type II secretion system protein GspF [Oleiphilus sp. HI0071]|uniref:type II secretion system inner membrane protein GspF n=1 Tax=unclassified Oleiphilus TaxID=2631174 RepID=UPI0007C3A585|nr:MULTISPECIES: type II secretion system inner membrane protein GspF [unclassified Oleiphilus]KZY74752.1 type II secretion system protein GspF [Oleiphilus sp. HI0065]KZY87126.1 type II secretion system protein GspF [Oleiphilus sp. HI0071]KZY91294.1 type II secretion system protein GspF [Oleiphilus sp. HI0073]KZZ42318.1 type II secretion system protein GspF [Oleiphilus sp. HI0118]KZZ60235.1 type II secretion system protein GspF [Oleiphilus sp. HI0122]KZZ64587.1 type II secretion system protei